MSIEDLRTKYRCDVCFDVSDGNASERSGHGRCEAHTRYAYLVGDAYRTDDEDAFVRRVDAELVSKWGEAPWPIAPREDVKNLRLRQTRHPAKGVTP